MGANHAIAIGRSPARDTEKPKVAILAVTAAPIADAGWRTGVA